MDISCYVYRIVEVYGGQGQGQLQNSKNLFNILLSVFWTKKHFSYEILNLLSKRELAWGLDINIFLFYDKNGLNFLPIFMFII